MLVPMHGTGLAMPSRSSPWLWAYPRTDNMARRVSSAGVSSLVPAGAERRRAPLPAPGIAASVQLKEWYQAPGAAATTWGAAPRAAVVYKPGGAPWAQPPGVYGVKRRALGARCCAAAGRACAASRGRRSGRPGAEERKWCSMLVACRPNPSEPPALEQWVWHPAPALPSLQHSTVPPKCGTLQQRRCPRPTGAAASPSKIRFPDEPTAAAATRALPAGPMQQLLQLRQPGALTPAPRSCCRRGKPAWAACSAWPRGG
jgi:hypothetical protein